MDGLKPAESARGGETAAGTRRQPVLTPPRDNNSLQRRTPAGLTARFNKITNGDAPVVCRWLTARHIRPLGIETGGSTGLIRVGRTAAATSTMLWAEVPPQARPIFA